MKTAVVDITSLIQESPDLFCSLFFNSIIGIWAAVPRDEPAVDHVQRPVAVTSLVFVLCLFILGGSTDRQFRRPVRHCLSSVANDWPCYRVTVLVNVNVVNHL